VDNPETFSGAPTMGKDQSAERPPASTPGQAGQVEFDDSKTAADYANFCRLLQGPEELLMDFGINLHPLGTSAQPVVVTQRVVTGWYTAKRLLHVLQVAIERHEAAFGVLETDVQKRVRRT
jgi:hypothetical protein